MTSTSLFQSVGLLGKAVALSNVAVLAILPILWFFPLLKTRSFVFVSSEISIWRGAWELLGSDLFLFCVLVGFAMVMPMVKALIYIAIWFSPIRHRPFLSIVGAITAKLSMTDILLVAITIVGVKGLGAGRVEPMFGLYIFSIIVIASLLISAYTDITQKAVLQRVPVVRISYDEK